MPALVLSSEREALLEFILIEFLFEVWVLLDHDSSQSKASSHDGAVDRDREDDDTHDEDHARAHDRTAWVSLSCGASICARSNVPKE